MSLETNEWTELSPDQADFFRVQVQAANQMAFGPTAHEAGIGQLYAGRFSVDGSSGYA
ncbi:MAG TPA: hypothetical protein VKQ34_02745 [Candidatus Saccharimonadales bacterium]|nr:hypothetical protein [Candidatus Saccharimonadales bacterium]